MAACENRLAVPAILINNACYDFEVPFVELSPEAPCRKLTEKRFDGLHRLWLWIFQKPRPPLPPDATLYRQTRKRMIPDNSRARFWSAAIQIEFMHSR